MSQRTRAFAFAAGVCLEQALKKKQRPCGLFLRQRQPDESAEYSHQAGAKTGLGQSLESVSWPLDSVCASDAGMKNASFIGMAAICASATVFAAFSPGTFVQGKI